MVTSLCHLMVPTLRICFQPSSAQNLKNYDALFVSTNAASDEKTRAALDQNEQQIETFLRSGKGLYLGYQKKMSVEDDRRGNRRNHTSRAVSRLNDESPGVRDGY